MKIRIPKRLKVRPQWRGLPIPYIAMINDDGKPDFRVTDEHKRASVIRNRWCQLCGEPLGKYFFFVGGTDAAKHNAYFEPATHLDCLMYAMQVCPFIVGRIEHADVGKIQAEYEGKEAKRVAAGGVVIEADSTFSTVRNPWWVIKKATDWKLARTKEGTILLVPDVIRATEPLHPETMTAADWKKVMEELAE